MTQLPPNSSNSRLCVIGEADPFLANLLHRFAQKSGLRIKRAQTGETVLDLVRREKTALVILDPDLPGTLRGWDAVRELRGDETTCNIPLVVCTWLIKAEVHEKLGLDFAYLQKPDLHYQSFVAALEVAGFEMNRP